ncbi:F-box/kelch-repeat protein At3g06240 [Linum grandiflorum]
MSGGENTETGGSSSTGTHFFTEDIVINILQWLPILSCIARFRCVCRSWRALLSDPEFIRRIIFSPSQKKSLQVLVTGFRVLSQQGKINVAFSPLSYSIYSYETLRPITREWIPLFGPDVNAFSSVMGCCDGIFCISHTKKIRGGNYEHSVMLWNPATWETKIVPQSPTRHPSSYLYLRAQRVGFGYDPKTNDYKVVRTVEFVECSFEDDHVMDCGGNPLVFTEVYSLRNDSWKTLNVDAHSVEGRYVYEDMVYQLMHLRQQQWDTYRNEKCYWFRDEQSEGVSAVISFDMSDEVFELVTIPHPTGLAHHDEDDSDNPFRDINHHVNTWGIVSCFMLKSRALLVTFSSGCFKCDRTSVPNEETWVMLKYGVAESWTKLRTWSQSIYFNGHLELWKGGTYICVQDGLVSVYNADTDETILENVEIEGRVVELQAYAFAPTQVSMSQLVWPELDG